jgi:hypothetical protein
MWGTPWEVISWPDGEGGDVLDRDDPGVPRCGGKVLYTTGPRFVDLTGEPEVGRQTRNHMRLMGVGDPERLPGHRAHLAALDTLKLGGSDMYLSNRT